MIHRIFHGVLLSFTLLAWSSSARAWVWTDGGADPLYGCSDTLHPADADAPEHEWSSIAGTGTRFTLYDDQVTGAIPIGFTFNFYERDYGNVYVSSNGYIGFLAGMSNGCCSGRPIPSGDSIDGIIAFMWDDLYPPNGNMYYQTIGVPGERMFIVEFNGVPRCCGTSNRVTVQLVLQEGTSNIYMHYVGDGDSANTTTIGIENETGTRGIQILNGATSLVNYSGATIYCSPLYLDADGDGFGPEEDCDDTDPEVNPDADEVCDGIDNDCDDLIDEGFDRDGDGVTSCGGDCDETDAAIHPGAPERCNDQDDDCDDAIDEGFDIDRDGFTACGGDCNDSNPTIHPGADEVCNSRDDDCDGEIDEGMMRTFYGDFDRDGFGDPTRPRNACERPAQHVENSTDCDDTDAAVNPSASEACNDNDDDCDGEIDEGLLSTFFYDNDRDGFGDPLTSTEACSRPPLHVDNSTDCNDTDRTIHPDAADACDGIDNDCDGIIDNGATSTIFYADTDGDGHGDPENTITACVAPAGYVSNSDDCNDTAPEMYPGAAEVCDSVDNNCDGVVDEGLAITFYTDGDGDGFGDPDRGEVLCVEPVGFVENSDDCDDTDASIAPGAEDPCDGIDNDCNGTIDDGAAASTYFFDGDGDGFGDPFITVSACLAPPGYVGNAGDCDDTEATIHPGALEVCDGLDQDCDGTPDNGTPVTTFYTDADGDGFGDPEHSIRACVTPEGYVVDDRDCDDTNAAINPDAIEAADLLDNNCNSSIDEGNLTGGTASACRCASAGQTFGGFFRSVFFRLLLGWLGL